MTRTFFISRCRLIEKKQYNEKGNKGKYRNRERKNVKGEGKLKGMNTNKRQYQIII